MDDIEVEYHWRGPCTDQELSRLHAAAFGHADVLDPWTERLERHSWGWLTARWQGTLIGFVNLVTDGGCHLFLLDTAVEPGRQGRGIGRELVDRAIAASRGGGAEWLHVDFGPELAPFYLRPDGFTPTPAGLVRLV